MNTQSNTVPDSTIASQATTSKTMSATRPLYWSMRRELWENRSIYVAPLLFAAVLLFGFLISTVHLPDRRRAVLLLDLAQQQAAIDKPYDIAAMLLILTAFIVGVFYCLDALHGERRDRSILFWKSLPVSDLTTVLAKASIPLVVLPLVLFVVVVVTQLTMLVVSTAILLMNDLGATAAHWSPFQQSLVLLYGLITQALWHAPIFAWLLLLSAWARRATFLWAVLPPLAISVLEKIALGSWHFASLLKYRLLGQTAEAFAGNANGTTIHSLSQLTPGNFLSTPGLWIGLAFAAVFLATAVRLRRQGGPI